MWQWLAGNLRTFVLAFLLALVVWVSAVTQANPDETRAYPRSLPIEIIGQDPAMVLTSELPRSISLELRAPRSVWEQIDADPNAVRAIVDLSGLADGMHEVNVQVQVSITPSRIVSQSPARIYVTLEPLVTRTLPVEAILSGEPAIGYQIGNALIEPESVVISGPRSRVEEAVSAQVVINISGARSSLDVALTPQILNQDLNMISGLSILPTQVQASLPIVQQGGYRDLAVKVLVTGQVASGYRLTNIVVEPPVVTVFSADAQLVAGLPGFVETALLDLNNAQGDIETRLALNLPEGVSAVGEQTVMVRATVSAIESSLTISSKEVEVIGLAKGLFAEISPLTVDLILSGPLPVLDTLRPEDVRVTVDLSGLRDGTHSITPRIEIVASGVAVQTLNPATIQVLITKQAPTPTP